MSTPDYSNNPYGQAPYGAVPYGVGVPKPVGWFVVNWLFCWPLAVYSLISAWGNIDRALFAGDIQGTQYQAARVKKFGIIGLCVGIGLTILWIVTVFAIFAGATGCNPGFANGC